MTRDDAVKLVRAFGQQRTEASLREKLPQRYCEEVLDCCAEDHVDALMVLGILKCEPPKPAEPETALPIG